MAEQLLSGTRIGSVDSPSEIMNWATHGIRPGWIRQFLNSAFLQHADYLVGPSDEQAVAATEIDESNWDILFLGDDDGTMSETAIANQVSRLARNHALECIIVVLSDSSAELRNRFLMFGAVDVLHLGDSVQRIREGIRHAADLVQARHCQTGQEKMSMVNRLAISVNHEINNPLTELMGTTELMLRKKDQLDEDMGHHLTTIIEQCHRIRGHI